MTGTLDHDHRLADLQAQLDRRIETQHREVDAIVATLEAKIAALDERVKVIFSEQRHAQVTAEQEREKAAEQLRLAMERLIAEGDANLERHVEAQVESIKAALKAVEMLGEEKDRRLEAIREAAQMAVDKALIAQKEMAEKHNDLIRSGERKEATYVTKGELDQIRELVAKAVPREVLETKLGAIEKEVSALEKARHHSDGGSAAIERRQTQTQPWMIWAAGAVLAIFTTLVIIIANVLTV